MLPGNLLILSKYYFFNDKFKMLKGFFELNINKNMSFRSLFIHFITLGSQFFISPYDRISHICAIFCCVAEGGPTFNQHWLDWLDQFWVVVEPALETLIQHHSSIKASLLRYIVGFWLVEMAISTNQKPTIYRNVYENTDPGVIQR